MNFATLYGQGPHALSRQLGIDFNTAKIYIEEYFAQFPNVKAWMSQTLNCAYQEGFTQTLWGRKRFFPELKSDNRIFRAAGERAAVNHPVQGCAADMIKKAMVEIDQQLDQKAKGKRQRCQMILQVHDELLFECDPGDVKKVARMVKEKMEQALQLSIPVVVDLKSGKNWGEMEKLKIE